VLLHVSNLKGRCDSADRLRDTPGYGLVVDRSTVPLPGWLDWHWALAVLDAETRVPGELVRPAQQLISTPALLAGGPAEVTVKVNGDRLVIIPAAAADAVRQRFHLGLDQRAVSAALERAELPGLTTGTGTGWVRRPAASSLWAYLLVYLSGQDANGAAVGRLFAELGPRDRELTVPPDPADLLDAGDDAIVGCGIASHRVANLLGLAREFAARPEHYDEVVLRGLPGRQAVRRLAGLPHIGAARAAAIAAGPLGHDDVLPDLSRQDEQLGRMLGLSWSRVLASSEQAAPYRSVLGDTLRELMTQ
jgi:3-methyladenine DNA glycosylase/8-oxoguanine DNA glycosylase